MLRPVLTKYGFRIKTRVGLVMNNLMIHGNDVEEAHRKLRQMYRDCEIIECVRYHDGERTVIEDFEQAPRLPQLDLS